MQYNALISQKKKASYKYTRFHKSFGKSLKKSDINRILYYLCHHISSKPAEVLVPGNKYNKSMKKKTLIQELDHFMQVLEAVNGEKEC